MEAILDNSYTWASLSFLVFLFGFIKLALPGILKALDSRSDAIRSQLDEAVQLRESAQALLAEFQQKQKEMQAEAETVLSQAKKEAASMKKQAEEELTQMIERRTKLAHDNIARAEAAALNDIQSMIVSLSMDSARTLLGEQLNEDSSKALIDRSLEDIKAAIH